MDTLSRFIIPGAIFLLTVASGLWLGLSGKPLNGAIFNLHKLIALAGVVLTVLQVVRGLKGAEVQAPVVGLLVLAAVCVVALFATGALMSIGKVDYSWMRTIHNIALGLLVLAMAAQVYLLAGRAG
ncbi:MAG TPA: hypothetical protein VMT46_11355 [Anaerolineaceae bacterium]|nr:hypothetical protein [Anaerolineaceae bacterium]